jgi:hypothetical protein
MGINDSAFDLLLELLYGGAPWRMLEWNHYTELALIPREFDAGRTQIPERAYATPARFRLRETIPDS